MAPRCPELARSSGLSGGFQSVSLYSPARCEVAAPHVARVSAAAGEQYRDLAMPRFEFKLGENRRNHRDQREESPFRCGQHSEQVELGLQFAKSGVNFVRLLLRDRFMGPRAGLPTLYP